LPIGRGAVLARSFGYVPQMHIPPFAFEVREIVLMARAAHLARLPRRAGRPAHRRPSARLSCILHWLPRATPRSAAANASCPDCSPLAQQAQWLILDEQRRASTWETRSKSSRHKRVGQNRFGCVMTTHAARYAFLYASVAWFDDEGRILAVDTPRRRSPNPC